MSEIDIEKEKIACTEAFYGKAVDQGAIHDEHLYWKGWQRRAEKACLREQLMENEIARLTGIVFKRGQERDALIASVVDARQWLEATVSLHFTQQEQTCWIKGMEILRRIA